jgi:hypothetical protein
MSTTQLPLTGDLLQDFHALYVAASGNADSETGRFMLYCDDKRDELLMVLRREKILTDAMSEVHASIGGRSTQPLRSIVNGCMEELRNL